MKEQIFKIEGMTCKHCVMAVKVELEELGLESFDVEIGSAKVKYDETKISESKIIDAIKEAGYNVVA